VPRIVKDARLETRTARAKLNARADPYYRALESGLHLGYRKGQSSGKWVARRYTGEKYIVETLPGIADDTQDATGSTILDYAAAVAAARAAHARAMAGVVEMGRPYTVAAAMAAYRTDYIGRGGRGLGTLDSAINARILPALGSIELAKLTTAHIRTWHRSIATGGRLARPRADGERKDHHTAPTDPDVIRQRRAAANRILTVLKAGLNHAFAEGKAASDAAWRRVKPFRDVDLAATRYLSADECGRLVNASAADFRKLVQAALLTGCRYGELVALRVGDFDGAAGTLLIRMSKAGKSRNVILTTEGREFFSTVTAGRPAAATVFVKSDDKPWTRTEQRRPMAAACKSARIDPPVGFHVLRHSHASFLASRGVALPVIAEQLGHGDLRMTKRYSHMSPGYVADAIRAGFPTLGIVQPAKVARIRGRR